MVYILCGLTDEDGYRKYKLCPFTRRECLGDACMIYRDGRCGIERSEQAC